MKYSGFADGTFHCLSPPWVEFPSLTENGDVTDPAAATPSGELICAENRSLCSRYRHTKTTLTVPLLAIHRQPCPRERERERTITKTTLVCLLNCGNSCISCSAFNLHNYTFTFQFPPGHEPRPKGGVDEQMQKGLSTFSILGFIACSNVLLNRQNFCAQRI